jgi:uncharacterized protein (TIGR02453 family)
MRTTKPTFPGFPPEALRFLRQLKRHNDRSWFSERRETYEQRVKAFMIELVRALGRELLTYAPEMIVEPSRAIYRIYRDVRFSPDKRPYKTHIAAIFTPQGISKHAGAGLYFHIAPEEVLIAGGVYMPGSVELLAIRRHIANHYEELREILARRAFRRLFGGLEGEALSRPPKGFSATHPAIDLLRYKQFLVSASYPSRLAETSQLLPEVNRHFQVMMPLVRFLNSPLVTQSATQLRASKTSFPAAEKLW